MEDQGEIVEKVEYGTVWSKCEFNSEELRDIAEKLAIKTQDLDTAEAEKKSVMSSFKDTIDTISMDIRKSSRLYRDKFEMRDVECVIERNKELGVVTYIRTDNGEIAKETKMTMAERQLTIDDAIEKTQTKITDSEFNPQQDATSRLMTSETSVAQ